MTQEMPTPPTNEQLLQAGMQDSRIFMWMTLKTGTLDEVAPLDTEKGVEMRLQLDRELTVGALLLSGMDLITEEEGNRITHALYEFSKEIYEAAQELGMENVPHPDELASPTDFGIPGEEE